MRYQEHGGAEGRVGLEELPQGEEGLGAHATKHTTAHGSTKNNIPTPHPAPLTPSYLLIADTTV